MTVKQMSKEELIDRVIDWVRVNKHSSADVNISADSELLESGLLDSFGLLDLIVYIENETGHKIELADADPQEFSVIRGLCYLGLRNSS